MTKFGVVALSETLHHELRMASGGKVNVSVLCPGRVNTRIAESERNRPATLADTGVQRPEVEAMQTNLRNLLQSGLAPAQVAEHVFTAIRDARSPLGRCKLPSPPGC